MTDFVVDLNDRVAGDDGDGDQIVAVDTQLEGEGIGQSTQLDPVNGVNAEAHDGHGNRADLVVAHNGSHLYDPKPTNYSLTHSGTQESGLELSTVHCNSVTSMRRSPPCMTPAIPTDNLPALCRREPGIVHLFFRLSRQSPAGILRTWRNVTVAKQPSTGKIFLFQDSTRTQLYDTIAASLRSSLP
ncbi:hypothetical protein BJY00DRAFT_282396 [Aspergillus carlsbadensis]|nr:hypothetical protein BJY00DRAFT_282396 [Aspergillus carlsbadensis]